MQRIKLKSRGFCSPVAESRDQVVHGYEKRTWEGDSPHKNQTLLPYMFHPLKNKWICVTARSQGDFIRNPAPNPFFFSPNSCFWFPQSRINLWGLSCSVPTDSTITTRCWACCLSSPSPSLWTKKCQLTEMSGLPRLSLTCSAKEDERAACVAKHPPHIWKKPDPCHSTVCECGFKYQIGVNCSPLGWSSA